MLGADAGDQGQADTRHDRHLDCGLEVGQVLPAELALRRAGGEVVQEATDVRRRWFGDRVK